MHVSDFDYHLPSERIAQVPAEPRDSAKLFVAVDPERFEHRQVRDLHEYLHPGDVVVVNDTKVLPARLKLERSSGGAVEVLLLEARDEESRSWSALVRPGGRLKGGEVLEHRSTGSKVVFHGRSQDSDTFVVELLHDGNALEFVTRIGSLPLPPYVQGTISNVDRYQTVYARRAASTAAPTAGLHLTRDLIETLTRKGVRFTSVELVVGVDTFRPIQTDDPRDHLIHSEYYNVPEQTMKEVQEAQRVVAIGTTAVRSLESAATSGELSGRTELFIHSDYDWKVVDSVLTNFHMPRSTLLLLIDAFTRGLWRRIYAEALTREYRFLSFGDAMLLDRHSAGSFRKDETR